MGPEKQVSHQFPFLPGEELSPTRRLDEKMLLTLATTLRQTPRTPLLWAGTKHLKAPRGSKEVPVLSRFRFLPAPWGSHTTRRKASRPVQRVLHTEMSRALGAHSQRAKKERLHVKGLRRQRRAFHSGRWDGNEQKGERGNQGIAWRMCRACGGKPEEASLPGADMWPNKQVGTRFKRPRPPG